MNNKIKVKMRTAAVASAVLMCGVTGAMLGTARPAFAQAATDTNSEKPISLNMQTADVKVLLKALFAEAGANYSIDSDVSGTVSITMNNVGFLAALRSVLHANTPPLTYDYTDGVYHIRVRKTDTGGNNATTTQFTTSSGTSSDNGNSGGGSTDTTNGAGMRPYRIPIDHYDVQLLMSFLASNPPTATLPSGPSNGGGAGGMRGGGMGGGIGGGMTGGIAGGMGGMQGGMGGGVTTGGYSGGGMGGYSGGGGMVGSPML